MDASVLTAARAARGFTRQTVAERTKLSPRVIAAIEDGRYDQLPAGLYARAFLRSYLTVVGLDGGALAQQLIDTLPKENVELETIVKCREVPGCARSRCRAAAALDALVVAGISLGGVLVCVLLTGPQAWGAFEVVTAFAVLAAPTLVLYFGLLGATDVGTAGARLLHVDFLRQLNRPLDGTELLARIGEYVCSVALALVTGRVPA